MRLPTRKSKLQRLRQTITDSVDVPNGIKFGRASGTKFGLTGAGSRNPLKTGLPESNVLKAGLIAGGLAGVTAGSAGISSLRRRNEGAREDS